MEITARTNLVFLLFYCVCISTKTDDEYRFGSNDVALSDFLRMAKNRRRFFASERMFECAAAPFDFRKPPSVFVFC